MLELSQPNSKGSFVESLEMLEFQMNKYADSTAKDTYSLPCCMNRIGFAHFLN